MSLLHSLLLLLPKIVANKYPGHFFFFFFILDTFHSHNHNGMLSDEQMKKGQYKMVKSLAHMAGYWLNPTQADGSKG